jgi:hypothetical protein
MHSTPEESVFALKNKEIISKTSDNIDLNVLSAEGGLKSFSDATAYD